MLMLQYGIFPSRIGQMPQRGTKYPTENTKKIGQTPIKGNTFQHRNPTPGMTTAPFLRLLHDGHNTTHDNAPYASPWEHIPKQQDHLPKAVNNR